MGPLEKKREEKKRREGARQPTTVDVAREGPADPPDPRRDAPDADPVPVAACLPSCDAIDPLSDADVARTVIEEWRAVLADLGGRAREGFTQPPDVMAGALEFAEAVPDAGERAEVIRRVASDAKFLQGGISFRKFLKWWPGAATVAPMPTMSPERRRMPTADETAIMAGIARAKAKGPTA